MLMVANAAAPDYAGPGITALKLMLAKGLGRCDCMKGTDCTAPRMETAAAVAAPGDIATAPGARTACTVPHTDLQRSTETHGSADFLSQRVSHLSSNLSITPSDVGLQDPQALSKTSIRFKESRPHVYMSCGASMSSLEDRMSYHESNSGRCSHPGCMGMVFP